MQITKLLVSGLLAAVLPVQFAIADADGERAALCPDHPRTSGHGSADHGSGFSSQS